jgi:hypothetical protein
MNRSPNRILALVCAALLLALGVLGLVLPVGVVPFAGSLSQSVIHFVLGAALAVGSAIGVRTSRKINAIVGTALLVLGLIGLFLAGSPDDPLGVSAAGNAIHFAFAVVLLAAGLGAERPTRER